MPENTIYVGRPSKWGNPFRVGYFVTFPEKGAIYWMCWERQYATSVYTEMKTVDDVLTAYRTYLERSKQDYSKLKGKDLACWCRAGEKCHADILLEFANQT
jgi:hypothetical protein